MVKNKGTSLPVAGSSLSPLPLRGLVALWRLARSKGGCDAFGGFMDVLSKMGEDLFPDASEWRKRVGGIEGVEGVREDWRSIGDVCWKEGAEREERRLAGSFYTPEFLIDQILDVVWGDIVPGVEDSERAVPVCDPAMGCGFFYLRLVERLLEAGLGLGAVRRWVRRNVYGVDRDANAVLLARALLWVTLSDRGDQFWPDGRMLCCGDSLLGPGFGQEGEGEGVAWGEAFPEVGGAGGFGVVLGNPPYEVLTNFSRNPAAKEYARRLRECGWYGDALRGQINLYRCFIERGLGLLREGGALSFVVPLSLARDGVAEGLRRRLLWREGAGVWRLYGEGEAGFEGVTQSVCVFGARRGGGVAKGVRVYSSKGEAELGVGELEGFGGGVSAIPEAGETELRLWRWIRENVEGALGGVATMKVGEVDQTVYRDCMRDEDTGCVLGRGAHLRPFVLDVEARAGRERFLDRTLFWKKRGTGGGARERVEVGRVAQLGIRNMRTRPRLVAGIVPAGVYLGNSLNVFYPKEGASLLLLCGVLNSRLLDWMFCLGSGNNNINLREMEGLPFPVEFTVGAGLGVEEVTGRCVEAAEAGDVGALGKLRGELDRRVEELYCIPSELLQGVFV